MTVSSKSLKLLKNIRLEIFFFVKSRSIKALANKGKIDKEIISNKKFNEFKNIIFLNINWNFLLRI